MGVPKNDGGAARAAAARAIDAVLHDGRSLKAVLAESLQDIADVRDRALVEAICFHALRHQRRYRHALSRWMDRPLPQREHAIESLLLAGLATLTEQGQPAPAAESATAEAARLLRRPAFVGLANALLRRASREQWPASDDPAIEHSYPDWLAARLRADWPGDWQGLLAAGNQVAPLWLRVNPRTTDRTAYAQTLRAMDIASEAPEYPAHALRLDQGAAPTQLPGWSAGMVSVQDAAAQLTVAALSPRDGECILDACCAPGGKSAALLEAADIELTAIDNDPQRMARVDAALKRLRLDDRATLRTADAVDLDAWWNGASFDAVLLDAPCSATGIVRRQPDIKWHRRESDLAALNATQDRLLDALWRTVKPGGRLLYATCSILRVENAERIAAFLARTPDAAELPLDARFGRAANPGRQRMPGEDGMDGFYYALLGRQSAH